MEAKIQNPMKAMTGVELKTVLIFIFFMLLDLILNSSLKVRNPRWNTSLAWLLCLSLIHI